jgi:hypothetical protein
MRNSNGKVVSILFDEREFMSIRLGTAFLLFFVVFLGKAFAEQLPEYSNEWQDCKDTSECVFVREGYNWTCVNKAYEKEAKLFCRNIDQGGVARYSSFEEKRSMSFDQLPPLTTPVCSKGKCFCEDIKTCSVPGPQECKEDQDCMVFKLRNWVSINKKNKDQTDPYYGAIYCDQYQYPSPRAVCLKGKCSMKFNPE